MKHKIPQAQIDLYPFIFDKGDCRFLVNNHEVVLQCLRCDSLAVMPYADGEVEAYDCLDCKERLYEVEYV